MQSHVNSLLTQYHNKQITHRAFIDKLFDTGCSPRQVNKYLPKKYAQEYLEEYNLGSELLNEFEMQWAGSSSAGW
ncbi:hypothetical protein [Winogradskyella sediminis]|uniref:hypothetical protein n=1 Tax=Winogradskyella sediminis TaxID=1382466 RepID=UPI003AA86BBC